MSEYSTPDATSRRQVESDAQRAHAYSDELAGRIARLIRKNGRIEPLRGLSLYRATSPTEAVHSISNPAFCVIAQGSKEVLLGGDRYRYDSAHYLITTVNLPVVSQIIEASPQRPFLSLRLALDPAIVSSVMVESSFPVPRGHTAVKAINVSLLDAGLLDAAVRLIRLLDSPIEAHYLAPLVTREIIYRLLLGEQGGRLGHVTVLGGQSNRIAEAIEQMRKGFDQPLRIDAIARELGMSVSGFHHHFKAVTAMSPLQYQKQLRLQEARRLMLGEQLDAASAGHRVGYDDASHFNREYKRLFGAPPLRDVEQLRAFAMENSGL